jgi:hypothetical protein
MAENPHDDKQQAKGECNQSTEGPSAVLRNEVPGHLHRTVFFDVSPTQLFELEQPGQLGLAPRAVRQVLTEGPRLFHGEHSIREGLQLAAMLGGH